MNKPKTMRFCLLLIALMLVIAKFAAGGVLADQTNPFVKMPDPAHLPAGAGNGVAFSHDAIYMAVAHGTSPYVTIYKRSGDTFTRLNNPASLPASVGTDVAFSHESTYMAVTHDTSPFVTIYKRSGDTFAKLDNPAQLPAGKGLGVAFSHDSAYMVVTHETSPFVTIYKRSGDSFNKLANPANLPSHTVTSVAFSHDSTYMALAGTGWPYVTIFKRSGDSFTKLDNPAQTPVAHIMNCVAFSHDSTYLAAAGQLSVPYVAIYKRSGDTFTWLNTGLPSSTAYGVAFSHDSARMAAAHPDSPYVTIYNRSGDTFTKFDNLADLPTGMAFGVAFSYDSAYMAVAHANSPYISIYKNTLPPPPPERIFPAQYATVPGDSIEFQWSASPRADRYLLTVIRDADNTQLFHQDVGNNLSYTVTGFPYDDTDYRWTVAAGNANGFGSAADPWFIFLSGSPDKPSAPTLTAPDDGATVGGASITFEWTAPPGAADYHLQVWRTSNNSYIHNAAVGKTTSYTVSGFPNDGTQYRWRVRAGNSGGWGVYSVERSFTNQVVPAGSIQVFILPQEAIDAGARWKLTIDPADLWRNSGDTITGLAPGNYTITFKEISGLNRPADMGLDLEEGESVTIDGP